MENINGSYFKELVFKIHGLRLTNINLVCEMMAFTFEGYALHTQCLTRIIKNDDILATTMDYQSWDGETSENNDEWFNLDKYKTQISGGKVTAVKMNVLHDLEITLDNGVIIQIIIENGYTHYGEEREQYRFFEIAPEGEAENTEKDRKHYVVYVKRIEVN